MYVFFSSLTLFQLSVGYVLRLANKNPVELPKYEEFSQDSSRKVKVYVAIRFECIIFDNCF